MVNWGQSAVLPAKDIYHVDLRVALEWLDSRYRYLDENNQGTRYREALFIFGSFPVDDWATGIGSLSSYFPLIITYWLSMGKLNSSSRQNIESLLGKISPADPVTGALRYKIGEVESQNIQLVLQDILLR